LAAAERERAPILYKKKEEEASGERHEKTRRDAKTVLSAAYLQEKKPRHPNKRTRS